MIRKFRQTLGVWLIYLLRMRRGVAIFYGEPERARILDLIARVRKEKKMLLSDHEAYQIYMFTQKTAKIPGDIAEVGTYRGGSSKLIAEARGEGSEKHIYLFDTFEGLPGVSDIDASLFHIGQYATSEEGVREYMRVYKNISIYKGIFPQSAESIKNKKFSFVHLDVDTYESTKQCIEFFYPRMVRGGVILSHDYINSAGVRKSFDEFFADKPECVFESSWRQCMIVKL